MVLKLLPNFDLGGVVAVLSVASSVGSTGTSLAISLVAPGSWLWARLQANTKMNNNIRGFISKTDFFKGLV
jgi:hypothetical protein